MIDVALQIILVMLLLLTITWCVIVHQRLRRLRTDRSELQDFVVALGQATERAEAAVARMQEANAAVQAKAVDQERRARRQSEDLARLMDNAVRVMKRLDAAVESGATRVAELRTRQIDDTPSRAEPVRAATRHGSGSSSPVVAVDTPRRPRSATAEGGRSLTGGDVSSSLNDRPGNRSEPGSQRTLSAMTGAISRRVSREGRLDGLLRGELREALQALR